MSDNLPTQVDDQVTDQPADQLPAAQVDQVAGEQEQQAVVEPGETEEQKLSRFQRFKQEYNAKLTQVQQEAEYWKRVALEASQTPPQPVPANDEPTIEDFAGQPIDEYLKAHAKWTERQIIGKAREEALAAVEAAKMQQDLQRKVMEARKKYPDWDEAMAASSVSALQDTAQFILQSEAGTDIAMYLAKNQTEHARLNSLPPMRRLAELGKLEDKLSAPVAQRKVETKAPVKLSNVNGSGVTTTDTAAAARQGYAAWKAARDAQKGKR